MKFKKPHFSLKLQPSAGTYADDPRWSVSKHFFAELCECWLNLQNADIDPVPVAARVWGIGSFASYWVSDMLAVCYPVPSIIPYGSLYLVPSLLCGRPSQLPCLSDSLPVKSSPVSLVTCHIALTYSNTILIAVTFAGFFICGVLHPLPLRYNPILIWSRSRYRRQSHGFHRCHISCPVPRNCQGLVVRESLLLLFVPGKLTSASISGMWGCIPMIFLRSTVALLWTAISVVQVSIRLLCPLSIYFIYWLILGRRFPWEYDFCYLAQIPDLESSSRIG